MRRDTRSQATNTGLMSLLLMLANQVRRMDEKPPVTIALVAGLAHITDREDAVHGKGHSISADHIISTEWYTPVGLKQTC